MVNLKKCRYIGYAKYKRKRRENVAFHFSDVDRDEERGDLKVTGRGYEDASLGWRSANEHLLRSFCQSRGAG